MGYKCSVHQKLESTCFSLSYSTVHFIYAKCCYSVTSVNPAGLLTSLSFLWAWKADLQFYYCHLLMVIESNDQMSNSIHPIFTFLFLSITAENKMTFAQCVLLLDGFGLQAVTTWHFLSISSPDKGDEEMCSVFFGSSAWWRWSHLDNRPLGFLLASLQNQMQIRPLFRRSKLKLVSLFHLIKIITPFWHFPSRGFIFFCPRSSDRGVNRTLRGIFSVLHL